VSYEMMDVSGMALASHRLGRDDAKDLSRLAIKNLGQFRTVEDLERAYYNHYPIMIEGTRSERAEGERALRKALALVRARMRNIRWKLSRGGRMRLPAWPHRDDRAITRPAFHHHGSQRQPRRVERGSDRPRRDGAPQCRRYDMVASCSWVPF
jgi:hypothetical protein